MTSPEVVFKVLEITYLVFFLPLSCYETDEVFNFMWVAVVVYGVGLAQIVFLHVNNFITKKMKHYRLIYKSLGYWVELPSGVRAPDEVFEWDRDRFPLLEKNVLSIRYRGAVYLKVLKNDSYFMVNKKQVGWLDVFLLVFLKGITSTRDSGRTLWSFRCWCRVSSSPFWPPSSPTPTCPSASNSSPPSSS